MPRRTPAATSAPAPRRSRPLLAVLLALALLLATACTGKDAGTAPRSGQVAVPRRATATTVPVPRLTWRGCGGGMRCAKLPVPLDWSAPDRGTIDLALIELPAAKPRQRIGALVTNPGGPGGSGVEFVRAAGRGYFGAALRDRFDVVGFDPRGVGGSAPVRCFTDAQKNHELATNQIVPENAAEHAAMVDDARRFAAGCGRNDPRVLPHLTTGATARDLDLLRAALGQDRLTYMGISYGTVLGATYAALFPGRIRAMALDAAVDPAVWINDPAGTVRRQAVGFERAFDAFLADCKARGADCGFGNGDPGHAYDRLIARLDHHPIKAKSTADPRPVTAYVAFLAVNAALYSRPAWPELADALELADEEDDGGDLLALADQLSGRRADGTYDNLNDANAAVNCADEANPTDVAAYDRLAGSLARDAPRFGRAFGYTRLACAFWPAKGAGRFTGPFTAKGAPPILVVGTTGDPAAPYQWARSLARQLDSGVLLSWRGVNHGAYGGLNRCVDDAVNRYLIEVRPPRDGTVCG